MTATKTDGFVTDVPNNNDWRFSNSYSHLGTQISITGDAWVRIPRFASGPIEGFKASWDGRIEKGAIINWDDHTSLLYAVPEETIAGESSVLNARKKLYIGWCGVSPTNLSEIIIVWSIPVRILNKNNIKVTGGGTIEAVTITGRIMVIKMTTAIAIDAQAVWSVTFEAAAVAAYGTISKCFEQSEIDTTDIPDSPDPDVTLPAPVMPCPVNYKMGPAGEYTRPKPAHLTSDNLLFCYFCESPAATAVTTSTTSTTKSVAVVNAPVCGLPARCTYPFILVECYVCSTAGPTECQKPAPVWLVCQYLFGSLSPMEIWPIGKLHTIDVCNIPTEVYGQLSANADCCAYVDVIISGRCGGELAINGRWRGNLPGYKGQFVKLTYQCIKPCLTVCENQIDSEDIECFVEEDIFKPIPRCIPVTEFAEIVIDLTNISAVNGYTAISVSVLTAFDTTSFNAVTSLVTNTVKVIDDIKFGGVEYLTSLQTTEIVVPNLNTTDMYVLTDYSGLSALIITYIHRSSLLIPELKTSNVEIVTTVVTDEAIITSIGYTPQEVVKTLAFTDVRVVSSMGSNIFSDLLQASVGVLLVATSTINLNVLTALVTNSFIMSTPVTSIANVLTAYNTTVGNLLVDIKVGEFQYVSALATSAVGFVTTVVTDVKANLSIGVYPTQVVVSVPTVSFVAATGMNNVVVSNVLWHTAGELITDTKTVSLLKITTQTLSACYNPGVCVTTVTAPKGENAEFVSSINLIWAAVAVDVKTSLMNIVTSLVYFNIAYVEWLWPYGYYTSTARAYDPLEYAVTYVGTDNNGKYFTTANFVPTVLTSAGYTGLVYPTYALSDVVTSKYFFTGVVSIPDGGGYTTIPILTALEVFLYPCGNTTVSVVTTCYTADAGYIPVNITGPIITAVGTKAPGPGYVNIYVPSLHITNNSFVVNHNGIGAPVITYFNECTITYINYVEYATAFKVTDSGMYTLSYISSIAERNITVIANVESVYPITGIGTIAPNRETITLVSALYGTVVGVNPIVYGSVTVINATAYESITVINSIGYTNINIPTGVYLSPTIVAATYVSTVPNVVFVTACLNTNVPIITGFNVSTISYVSSHLNTNIAPITYISTFTPTRVVITEFSPEYTNISNITYVSYVTSMMQLTATQTKTITVINSIGYTNIDHITYLETFESSVVRDLYDQAGFIIDHIYGTDAFIVTHISNVTHTVAATDLLTSSIYMPTYVSVVNQNVVVNGLSKEFTVVTSCPGKEITYHKITSFTDREVYHSTNDGTTLIYKTSGGPIKLLARPTDTLACTVANWLRGDCCTTSPSCGQNVTPWEDPLEVWLMTGKVVMQDSGSAYQAPCYTCEPELPCDDGDRTRDMYDCGFYNIPVKRLQRNCSKWCK